MYIKCSQLFVPWPTSGQAFPSLEHSQALQHSLTAVQGDICTGNVYVGQCSAMKNKLFRSA